eukprot:gene7034-8178_t
MSWQAYVDDQLLAGGLCQGAILGLKGGVWATSKGLTIQPAEVTAICANIGTPKFSETGITAGGVKYLCIKAEDSSAYGKKGAGGIILVKTTQAIVVGVYDDKLQPGAAATCVEKLGMYY